MKFKNLLMTSIVIFALARISFGQTLPSYVPSNGLVGWWPFNGNANDESLNGNNGILNGGVTATNDRFGNNNAAYQLNGSDGFIEINNSTSMNFPNGYSSAGWVVFTENQVDNVLISKHFTGIQDGFVLGVLTNKARFYSNSVNLLSANDINNGSWHHLVATFNGTTMKLFLNGIQLDTINQGYLPNDFKVNIGKANGCCNFNGSLDDIGIWNRALTQAEITSLFIGSSLGTNEVSQFNLFTVYPNPAQNEINVNTDANLVGSVFAIYDNTGKVVKTGKLNSTKTTIELNDLSSGIYTFSVGENKKQTFKVIKE